MAPSDLSLSQPTALYIHVPFCQRKCHYCDFVSYPYNRHDARRYAQGVILELSLWARQLPEDITLTSVFMGGGTPTCLPTEDLLAVLKAVKQNFTLGPEAELTIEANPNTLNQRQLNLLRRAGVNRLSIGAQSCNQQTLQLLGRLHSHQQTVQSVQKARRAGFDNINLDLIFGVPGQTLRQWRRCLEQIITLQPQHISAYGLQIEPGTPLARMMNSGQLTPCEEETELDMYEAAGDILMTAGLKRYEISNYARAGYQCAHNLVYWRNLPYVGVGPAAHGYVGGHRLANWPDQPGYYKALAQNKLPLASREQVTLENEIFETIFLHLRLTSGLHLAQFSRRFGQSLDYFYPGLAEKLMGQGLLKNCKGRLALTKRGLALANVVMSQFVPPTKS